MKHSITIILIFLLLNACSYLPDDTLKNSDLVNRMYETAESIVVKHPSQTPDKTFLFYPGGLVDPHVYLKWQDSLVSANTGLQIITVKMPSNLAVLDARKGLKIINQYPDIDVWITGGHSLGGTMAAELIASDPTKFKALILIASYPASDKLKSWDGAVLSISAEKDGLTTRDDIQNNKINLPVAYTMNNSLDFQTPLQGKTHYFEITGGNHAGFGNYGLQDGDGIATIPVEKQQSELIQVISNFISKL
jgi:dienelactone hydrolase